ncbi:MAG TPA: type II toxin-antitoxin system VapC family toxin [Candidatus Saccharimonadales bacterium]|nr:type II toxin-antitoxin system VapC family toxin [Candidatus Saccharimonadales bacterium]
MTFLVDTNVIVYAAVPSRYRAACLEILDAVASGRADGRLSTAILEEIWHLERTGRLGDIDGLAEQSYRLFTPLLAVNDEIVARALQLEVPRIGANDRIHVATALLNGIDTIVSADAGLDDARSLRRVDPLDPAERGRLIRG